MQILDIRTITIIFFINSLLATLFMATLWYQSRKQFPGISLWLTSFALLTAAFVLISLRNVIPDAASIFIANNCVVAAVFILYLGLERFVACPSSQRHNYVMLAVFVGLFTYFTFFQPDIAIRIVLLNLTLMLIFLQSSWLLLRRVGSRFKPFSQTTGIICLLFALTGCYRLILVFFMPTPDNYLDMHHLDAIGLLIGQILTIGLVLSLLLMVNRRTLLNILNQEESLVRSKAELEISNRDLAERKQIETALRESEERWQFALEGTGDGLWDWNVPTNQLYFSPRWKALLGYGDDEIGNTLDEWDRRLHPDDYQRVYDDLGRYFDGLTPSFISEYRLLCKDGNYRWMLGRGKTITWTTEGQPLRVVGTQTDITERKTAEEELQKSRQELRGLSEHLISLMEEERMLLAREIHDELGQALTALKMDLSWLSKKLPEGKGPLASKTASMLKLVDTTVKTVKELSARLRPGLLDDLGLVAAIEWYAGEFQDRTGIITNLRLKLDDSKLDNEQATALFRIFQEVLTNVTRHAAATRIDVYLREIDGALELSVSDNGKGIEQEIINSSKSLGLLGIRERCLQLGGAVDIRGKRGKGTTVTVNLPAGEVRQ